MRVRTLAYLSLVLLSVAAPTAHAYIGPGAGAGVVAVVLGILAAIVMAFLAVLWYPLKRLWKRLGWGKRIARHSDPDGQGGMGGH